MKSVVSNDVADWKKIVQYVSPTNVFVAFMAIFSRVEKRGKIPTTTIKVSTLKILVASETIALIIVWLVFKTKYNEN